MLFDLPLELQYRIIELALPPLVRLAVDERVQACQTFALVHRDWTPFAQRELLNPVILRNKQSPTFPLEVSKRLRAARKGGRKVKRLLVDLNSGDVEGQHPELSEFLAAHLFEDGLEELWLHLGEEDECIRLTDIAISKLHVRDACGLANAPCVLQDLHPRLTYLAIHHANLESFALPPLPNLETLIIEDIIWVFDISTFFVNYPSLRIFGCKGNDEFCELPFFALIPTTLRHLALFHDEAIDALFTIFNNSPPKDALPRSLRSLFVSSGDQPSAPSPEGIKKACADVGIEFNHYQGRVDVELVDYEIEEWAYSVGA
ncbi:hypothetical protein RTBOTA2_006243 [Rhodotorula toruloides]|uniref:Proteophosphoglycan ppg4 n=1 Tax=Rhodotorula toruloides TaxID=5286 RepID=A0A2S9ZYK3_RHOTO|nr:hypothetical protein RTBOTA2_006243 [Rhodotorula toruloides]PRQ70859.1 hypothetical protein AAT19DRAFT_11016 [Rhodotorula toruloides]